ncbi:MAG: hypothetical protein ACYS8K_06695 [Planctomycetota bacterium]|jgi:hypothetical protein
MRRMCRVGVAVLFVLGSGVATTWGATVKGPYTFEDNAFVAAATLEQGSLGYLGGATNPTEAYTGADLAKGATLVNSAVVELTFDNAALNADGPDLVVFESHTPELFDVAVKLPSGKWSAFRTYTPVPLGFFEGGYQINGAEIDLSDFVHVPSGETVLSGEAVSVFRLAENPADVGPGIRGAGAINVVPLPPALVPGLIGLGMLAWWKRRTAGRTT